MKFRFGIFFRFLLAAYCLLTFFLAVFFSGIPYSSSGAAFLLTAALVFYIVSLGGLLIAHRKEGRPAIEAGLLFFYPLAVRCFIFRKCDVREPDFWLFIGVFTFIIIAGGFFLGIILSPLIARVRGQSAKKTGAAVRSGFRHIRRAVPLDFAVFFAGGVILALVLSFLRIFPSILPPDQGWSLAACAFLAAGTAGTAWFAYRHTRFGLNENRKLRSRYQPEEETST